MPVTLQAVTGNLEHITGTTPNAARLRFRMNRPDWTTTGEIFAPRDVEAVADPATGAFTVQLQQTDLLQQGSVYKAVLYYRDVISGEDREYTVGQFEVPAGGPHELTDLLEAGFVNPENAQTIADWLAQAQASAVAAAGSATAAAASADQAEVAAIAAGAPIFPTIAAGIAGVANGAVFMVPSGGDGLTIYRRNGTGADNLGGIRADTFDTRAQYATAVAAGFVPVAGRVYQIGGLPYQGSPGATWTGLNGVIPHVLNRVFIEHFGGASSANGGNSTGNNAALAAWYSALTAGVLADRSLNFGAGVYVYTAFPQMTLNSVMLVGRGGRSSATILQNMSPTTDGPVFGQSEGVATGNTTIGCGIRGIRISRSTADATAGRALTFQFCSNFVVEDFRFSQHHQGIEVIGSQDWNITNFEGFGMFSGTTGRPGSFLFRSRSGLKADGTRQAAWQGRINNFSLSGSANTEIGIDVLSADGLTIGDGYVNLCTVANWQIAPPAGSYVGPLFVHDIYHDGGFPENNVPKNLFVPNFGGSVFGAFFDNTFLGNGRDVGVEILGNLEIHFNGCDFQGLGTPRAKGMIVNNVNAGVYINGCRFRNYDRSIDCQNAAMLSITGGVLTGEGAGGYCVNLGTAVSRFISNGVSYRAFSGAADVQDTATGVRTWGENHSSITGSVLNGTRLLNLAPATNGERVLNWFERGTFTPTVEFDTISTGVTYTTQVGRFQRVGQIVTGNVRVVLSSRGGLLGEFRIKGLPYPVRATEGSTYPCAVRLNSVAASLDTASLVGDVIAPNDIRILRRNAGNQVAIGASELTDTANILLTFEYEVA